MVTTVFLSKARRPGLHPVQPGARSQRPSRGLARWYPRRAAEIHNSARTAWLLFAVFCLSVLGVRLLCSDDAGYTSFWPANAAMLVALLVLRARLAWAVIAGRAVANMLANQFSALSVPEAALACVLNVVQAVIAAPPTRRFCGALTDLTHPLRYALFLPIAFGATAVEAFVGVAIETWLLHDAGEPVAEWIQWVLCDALGLILATPAVIALVRRPAHPVAPSRALAVRLLVAGSVLLAIVSFLLPGASLFLMLFPALALVAFYASPMTSLLVVLAVAVIASVLTAHGLGPIARLSPDGHLMRESFIQPYLLALLLVVVPTSNAVGLKRRYMRRLSMLRSRLAAMAARDTLTAAESRLSFEAGLRRLIARSGKGALLLIDIDHFKQVNDGFGHQSGDLVLVEFARRLIEVGRPQGAHVGRLGGDEFVLYTEAELDRRGLDMFCCGVLACLGAPCRIGSHDHVVTASIGATLIDAGRMDMDAVIRRADRALYSAKGAGRNSHALAEEIESCPLPGAPQGLLAWEPALNAGGLRS